MQIFIILTYIHAWMYVKINNVFKTFRRFELARHTHEDAQKTRKAILDSALRLFSRRGYERTSLADIAKYAGVTRGAIYWHFDDKRELILELCNRTDCEFLATDQLIAATKPEEDNPLKCLREWMLALCEEKSIQYFRSSFFLLLCNIFRGMVDDDQLQKRFVELVEARRQIFLDIIKNCVRKGQLPKNVDVQAAAEYLMVFMNGYVSSFRAAFSSGLVNNFSLYVDLTLNQLKGITHELVSVHSSVRV